MGSLDFWATCNLDELLAAARVDSRGEAMAELTRRFEPLVRKIGIALSRCPMARDDVMNEARLALLLAVGRHRIGRPGFGRYAEVTMWGAARRWSKGWAKGGSVASIEDHEPVAASPITRGWGSGDVAQVVGNLSTSQQHLLAARYIDDADLGTMASASGTSESAVSQRLHTAHRAVAAGLAA